MKLGRNYGHSLEHSDKLIAVILKVMASGKEQVYEEEEFGFQDVEFNVAEGPMDVDVCKTPLKLERFSHV